MFCIGTNARCGLACCLCHENITCNGCNSDECKDKEWCENRKCSIEKEMSNCFLCENDCHKGLLSKMKPYGFTVFAKRYGLEALLDCLERNEKNGVIYHREELIGDYDNSYLPDWKIERQGDGILCRNI